MTSLSFLGMNEALQKQYEAEQIDLSQVCRVIREHKELYQLQNKEGIFNAEITGNMRYAAEQRSDFPAVGDWVEAVFFDDQQAIIHKILPRTSVFERQLIGGYGEKQIIATNIDKAFIVQAVDRDYNLNRLERYFVLAHNSGIQPMIILNKTDLLPKQQLEDISKEVQQRMKGSQLFCTSTVSGDGLPSIRNSLVPGETYCFIGSSGVGKSSIINYLLDKEYLATNEISNATNKGQHTTTHRELMVLDGGGILIDTPGMREVGMVDAGVGINLTFDEIIELSQQCKFNDCTHEDEPGCKVQEAIDAGDLSPEEFENFKKLERQTAHFTSTVAEKRKSDKAFGKMIKDTLKVKKRSKY